MNEILFEDFFNKVKDGDKILTLINWNKKVREVIYNQGVITCGGFEYSWNDFFSCNEPINIVTE